ncbi:MAG: hypothetical protein VX699_07095 [Myxococcota bacterium]|nr:hypothetical protein [Myxococcota bacterium]
MTDTLAILNRAALLPDPPGSARDVLASLPPRALIRTLPAQAVPPFTPQGPTTRRAQALKLMAEAAFEQTSKGPATTLAFCTQYGEDDAPPTLPGLNSPQRSHRGGPSAGLQLFITAARQISQGDHPRMLLTSSDVIDHDATQALQRFYSDASAPLPPLAEAATALWLGRADDERLGPRVGVRTLIGAPCLTHESLTAFLTPLVQPPGSFPVNVDRVISATSAPERFESETHAIERLFPNTPLLHLAWTTGQAGASLGLLGIHAALEESGTTLLVATDTEASAAVLLFTP